MPDNTITEARVAAIEAALADLTHLLEDTPPVGTILMLAHEAVDESRYLRCEGQSIDLSQPGNERFQRLFQKIGTTYGGDAQSFKLPNLQGEFPRFLDREGHADPNRKLGQPQSHRTALPQTPFTTASAGTHSHQIDAVGDHSHPLNLETTASRAARGDSQISNTAAYPPVNDNKHTAGGGGHNHTLHEAGEHHHAIVGGDSETAPRNVALVGCIRY